MATPKRTDGEDGPKRVTPYVEVNDSPGVPSTAKPRTQNPDYGKQTPTEGRARFERAAAQDSVPELVEQATAEAAARAKEAEDAEKAEAEAAEKAEKDGNKEVAVKHVAAVESTTHEASRAKAPAKP